MEMLFTQNQNLNIFIYMICKNYWSLVPIYCEYCNKDVFPLQILVIKKCSICLRTLS